jgi:hypothetical protein
MGQFWRR